MDVTRVNINNLIFKTIFFLIGLKLIFSYLLVEPSWWIRHLPTNYEKHNYLNLPQNFSGKLEYLLIPLFLLYIVRNFNKLNHLKNVIYISIVLVFLNVLTSFRSGIGVIESINHSLKIIAPVYFFIILVVQSQTNNVDLNRIMMKIVKLCLFLSLMALALFEISMNRKEVQWPIYFANIHTHSYILSSVAIGISYLIYKKGKIFNLFVFFIISFLVLYYGYGVRTVLILYLIFIAGTMYALHDFFKFLWIKILVFIPIIFMLLILLVQQFNWNKFSSGRLDMYQEKIDLLKDYNLIDYSIGRGYGSDFVKTESWWWDEKGSHSDVLTYIIENGFIYLFFFLFLLMSLIPNYSKINILYFSLIFGYFISSLISNGIAERPLAGYIFFMALAVVYRSIFIMNFEVNERYNA